MFLQHLKNWRKTFLTRCRKTHYSQFGEDIILQHIIGKKRDGFFVDVGCYHPKKFSNTYFFYKRGWRGINIDMEQHKIALFRLARKKDINVVSAISDQKERWYIKNNRAYDVFSTLSQTNAGQGEIHTQTLTDIIHQTPYQHRMIDLLTIDTEGHDYRVLNSLDFSIYQPRVVVVECHAKQLNDVLQSNIHLFMKEKNYRLRSWALFSLIYVQ